jgi:hypothetical protein
VQVVAVAVGQPVAQVVVLLPGSQLPAGKVLPPEAPPEPVLAVVAVVPPGASEPPLLGLPPEAPPPPVAEPPLAVLAVLPAAEPVWPAEARLLESPDEDMPPPPLADAPPLVVLDADRLSEPFAPPEPTTGLVLLATPATADAPSPCVAPPSLLQPSASTPSTAILSCGINLQIMGFS